VMRCDTIRCHAMVGWDMGAGAVIDCFLFQV
jgi:hypothetical protein